jgi:hypothetical protein
MDAVLVDVLGWERGFDVEMVRTGGGVVWEDVEVGGEDCDRAVDCGGVDEGLGAAVVAEAAVDTRAVTPFSLVTTSQVRFPIVAPRLPPTLAATATRMDAIQARMKNVLRSKPRIFASLGAAAAPAHTVPWSPWPAMYGAGRASLS